MRKSYNKNIDILALVFSFCLSILYKSLFYESFKKFKYQKSPACAGLFSYFLFSPEGAGVIALVGEALKRRHKGGGVVPIGNAVPFVRALLDFDGDLARPK